MKRFIKIFIITFCFIGGVGFAQSVTAGYTGTTAPCTQTLCQPFNQTDLRQVWQAIMFTSKNNTTTINGTVTVNGNVGGYTDKEHYAVPTSTTAYSVGDNIGGDIGIESLRRSSGLNFIIYEVAFFDSTGQSPELDVTFLTVPYSVNTDNTPTQFNNDKDRYLGSVHIASSDWRVIGTSSMCSIKYVGIICKGIEPYAIITTLSAVTYPTTSGLYMKIGALQD